MPIFSSTDRNTARAIGALSFANPFLPERIALEQEILADAFTNFGNTWSADPDLMGDNPNVIAIREKARTLSAQGRQALTAGKTPLPEEQRVYEELALYELYYRYQNAMYKDITAPSGPPGQRAKVRYFSEFEKDVHYFFNVPHFTPSDDLSPARLLGIFHQHRRAFHYIFRRIFGASMSISRLRASVWESVFTCDMRRYRRLFTDKMHDMATLITGPSGTGKELVAGAVGLSRYIPFDPNTGAFGESFEGNFHPLNLSALAPTLVESELFGHKKGAFTGANSDRAGYLENKGNHHTVFLDEIGDVDLSIQVKLLRVLQTREFQPLGDCTHRHFGGKIIAATNRDLADAIQKGAFRSDLYYRLCSDHIVTPSLAEQIAEEPNALEHLVDIITRRIVGEERHESIADQVNSWIVNNLGVHYTWPGNIRELEQCIRNIIVHGGYSPIATEPNHSPLEKTASEFAQGLLTAEEMLSKYYTLVYHRAGSYVETAERLKVDRRTVKARIDPGLLRALGDPKPR